MITQEQKKRLGIFIIASSIILIFTFLIFIVPKLREEGYPYQIYFLDMSVNGIIVGSPVKYQGVDIGKVTNISVNPGDLTVIRVDVRIMEGFTVKTDMKAVLQYIGITLQKYVEISGGRTDAPNIPPKGEIPAGRGLTEQAEDIIASVDRTLYNLNGLLSEENKENIAAILENTRKGSTVIADILEKRQGNLESALTGIETAAVKFGEVTESLFGVVQKLSEVTTRVEADTEKTFASLTKRLSDEEMGRVLNDLKTFIETATSNLEKFETLLIRQQETVTRTFVSLEETMDNISKFSRALTEDPAIVFRSQREKKK